MTKKKNEEEQNADERRKNLLKELRSLIKDIPEEGLLFLIQQANTILYNMKVEELNNTRERMERNKKSYGGKQQNPSRRGTPSPAVSVERSSFGRSFILILDGNRKIMSESEITKIVRIAHSADNVKNGADRIYTWLKRNRDDIVIDAGLHQGHHILEDLYTYLKKNFSLIQ